MSQLRPQLGRSLSNDTRRHSGNGAQDGHEIAALFGWGRGGVAPLRLCSPRVALQRSATREAEEDGSLGVRGGSRRSVVARFRGGHARRC